MMQQTEPGQAGRTDGQHASRVRNIRGFVAPAALILWMLASGLSAAEPIKVKPTWAPLEQLFTNSPSGQAVVSQGALTDFLVYPGDTHVTGTGELTFACWRKRTIRYPIMWTDLVSLPGIRTSAMKMAGDQPYYKKNGMGVTRLATSVEATREGKKWSVGYDPSPIGEWHHFAMTRGPSGLCVYVDGRLVGTQGKGLDAGFPGEGRISFAPQGELDEALLVRRELSAAEINDVMHRRRPLDTIKDVAAVWDFDGTVEARYFGAPGDSGCSLFWRTGKRLNVFRAADPTTIEFNAINWQGAATNATFRLLVETLDKRVLLDRRRDINLPAAGQRVWTEEIPPGTNGLFYVTAELVDTAGLPLDQDRFRVARTIAPDVKAIARDASFRTGVVEAGAYNWPEIGMKHFVPRSTSWGRRKFQPNEPIDWTDFDAEVDCAIRNGVDPIFMTCHIPAFEAVDGVSEEGGMPKDWNRLREFIEEALTRYRGRIRYIEVLNEPYFTYRADEVAQFARVYREAIDKVAPETQLIVPVGEPSAWGQSLIEQTVDIADIYQVHSYPNFNNSRHPVYGADEDQLLRLRQLIERSGGKQEIWNTEAGVCSPFGTYADGRPWTAEDVRRERAIEGTEASRVEGRAESEYDVASWITKGFIADAAGGVAVGCYFQYPMLTHGDHHPSLQMIAMGTFAGLITGSEYVGRLDLGTPEIRAYQFRKGVETILAIWTTLGSPRKTYVNCFVPEVTFVDLWGTPAPARTIAGVLEVQATPVPRYIRVPGHQVSNSVPVAALYPPEFLIAGQPANMRVVLSNPFDRDLNGTARLELPTGIRATPSQWLFALRGKGAVREEKVSIEVDPGIYYSSKPGMLRVVTDSKDLGTLEVQGLFSTRRAAVCKRVPTDIIIDGEINEWAGRSPLMLGAADQVATGTTRPPGNPDKTLKFDWEGANDLSASVYLGCDGTNLYLAADVTDGGALHNANRKTLQPYQGDCLELFLEIHNASGAKPSGSSKVLYQLVFVPWTADHPSASWVVMQPKDAALTGVRCVSRQTPKGWALEIVAPLSNFPGLVVQPGSVMDFNVAIDDSDGPEDTVRKGNRKTQLMWTGGADAHAASGGYGKVVFE